MKNYDYWKQFITTGHIDDYLNYIACTSEESMYDMKQATDKEKEGGFCASINYSDGNGTLGHAGW